MANNDDVEVGFLRRLVGGALGGGLGGLAGLLGANLIANDLYKEREALPENQRKAFVKELAKGSKTRFYTGILTFAAAVIGGSAYGERKAGDGPRAEHAAQQEQEKLESQNKVLEAEKTVLEEKSQWAEKTGKNPDELFTERTHQQTDSTAPQR